METIKPAQALLAFIIVALLCVGCSLPSTDSADSRAFLKQNTAESSAVEPAQRDTITLPTSVRDRLLEQAVIDFAAPVSALTVRSIQRETWPNGCLGLPQPEDLCSMSLVEGWRAEVVGEGRSMTYRLDETAQQIRREDQQ
ncbi:MAG: hypothetical protein ACFB4J_13355 [Elainellaceae cyanobacterium]